MTTYIEKIKSPIRNCSDGRKERSIRRRIQAEIKNFVQRHRGCQEWAGHRFIELNRSQRQTCVYRATGKLENWPLVPETIDLSEFL